MPLPRIIIEGPPTQPTKYGILAGPGGVTVLDPTDPHAAAGVQWEPDYCGPAHLTLAACTTITVPGGSVVQPQGAGPALFTFADCPNLALGIIEDDDGVYFIDWGDGTADDDFTCEDADDETVTHQYSESGTYIVTVTGPNGYLLVLGPIAIALTDTFQVSWGDGTVQADSVGVFTHVTAGTSTDWDGQEMSLDISAVALGGSNDTGCLLLHATDPAPGTTIDWGGAEGTDDLGVAPWTATHTYADGAEFEMSYTGPDWVNSGVYCNLWEHSLFSDAVVSAALETTEIPPFPKTPTDGKPLVESHAFTVYHLSTCRLVGADDAVEYAKRALALGEGRGIEFGLRDHLASEDVAAIDLLNGDTANVVSALGMLEAYAAANYGGTATIHGNRRLANLLIHANLLTQDGEVLRTKLGSLFVAGPGYDLLHPFSGDDPGTNPTSNRWMFATGAVVVTRSAIWASEVTLVSPMNNEYQVLTERPMSVGFECFAAAVQVDLSGIDGIDGGSP